MGPTSTFLAYVAAMETSLFLWITEATGRVAAGASTTLMVWPVLITVVAIPAGVPVLLTATNQAIERIAREEAAAK
ncbi:MAG: hypothetical protein ACOYN0_09750 [Phycisphaerales bacterium]